MALSSGAGNVGTRAKTLKDIDDKRGAGAFVPPEGSPLKQLHQAAEGCRGCDLYKQATQVVFGHGPSDAKVVLVGEQPGDQEDKQGQPFVGPAGALLRQALLEAGLDPASVYMTNAVKHFKWTPAPTGKRRIHAKPSAGEVRACRPWLEREFEALAPEVVGILGATAGQALLGPAFKVTTMRGRAITGTPWARHVVATIHPSAILRVPEDEARAEAYQQFIKDLKVIAKLVRPV